MNIKSINYCIYFNPKTFSATTFINYSSNIDLKKTNWSIWVFLGGGGARGAITESPCFGLSRFFGCACPPPPPLKNDGTCLVLTPFFCSDFFLVYRSQQICEKYRTKLIKILHTFPMLFCGIDILVAINLFILYLSRLKYFICDAFSIFSI